MVEEREDGTWSRKGKMAYDRGRGRWPTAEEGKDDILSRGLGGMIVYC